MEYQSAILTRTPEAIPLSDSLRSEPLVTRAPVYPMLRLQRAIGNESVQRLIQAKLQVNQPGDIYEQEAERIAAQVVSSSSSQGLQRRCACGGTAGPDGECAKCRMRRLALQRDETTKAEPSTEVLSVHPVLSSSGQVLDSGTRAFMESRFGHDFGDVRVHTDAKAAESAQAIGALAYLWAGTLYLGQGNITQKRVRDGGCWRTS